MGAKVIVKKAYFYTYLVRILNYGALPTSGSNSFEKHISIDAPVRREKARQLKNRLRGVAVCELADPPTTESTDYHKPTFAEPSETYYWRRYVNSSATSIVGDRFGVVLARLALPS